MNIRKFSEFGQNVMRKEGGIIKNGSLCFPAKKCPRVDGGLCSEKVREGTFVLLFKCAVFT